MSRRPGVIFSLAAVLLTACGGGGGDSEVVLSGSIAVVETALVDSDTNDVNQTARSANNSTDAAQPIASPLTLVGTVNLARHGPEGSNFLNGDADDFFRVPLVAGQVVELESSADPSRSDVDLFVLSADGRQVGASDGQDSRFECIEITTSGSYYVNVTAASSASIYNLRIGAPGSAGACANRTSALQFNPQELLVSPRPQALQMAASLQRNVGIESPDGDGHGPQLLHLPTNAGQMAKRLHSLGSTRPTGPISKSLSGHTTAAPAAPATSTALPAALATLRYAKALRATGAYVYVQPNWLMQRHALTGVFPPEDRNYSYQRWHYEQINLPAAMARIDGLVTKPALRPVVAVIDDGVVLNHPDFVGQLVTGCSFVRSEAAAGRCGATQGDNTARAQDNPVFHGTHVAGTIAAATFEPIGGAAVAPMAQVLPLRVFAPSSGGASSLDIIQAMKYAARLTNSSGTLPARRADVINLSLGSDRTCDAAYQAVINEVRAQGTMVVISAGNSGRNDLGQRVAVGSPANCAGAIAVGATDARKRLTYYSNTGDALTVAAPGGDTSQSTTGNGAPDSVYSDLATFDATGTRQPSFSGMMGTSMAAPHVAGVLALMRYVNPALTPGQVDTLITQGALTDDLGTAGRDIDFGWGLINARKAVDAALNATGNPPPEPPVQIVASPSSLDLGSFQSTTTFELQAAGVTPETVVSVTSSNAAVTVVPVSGTLGLGRYTVTVNRALLGGPGSYFPRLTVTLNPARTLFIQLSVTNPTVVGGTRVGDYGPLYVLLMNPETREVLHTVLATRTTTGYAWSFTGFTQSRVAIIAGGDLDNDDVICQRGEPCGGYPVLTSTGDIPGIDITGSRGNLSFQVAPLSGISAQQVSGRAAGYGRTPLAAGAAP